MTKLGNGILTPRGEMNSIQSFFFVILYINRSSLWSVFEATFQGKFVIQNHPKRFIRAAAAGNVVLDF